MFLVNSRLGLVSAAPSGFGREVLHPTGALLLPKLRSHFAEFLNQSYLARLSILYLSTCVGLGYGYPRSSLEAFLDGMGSTASPHSARHHVSAFVGSGFAWIPPYTLTPGQPSPGSTYPSASPHCWPNTSGVGRPRRAFLSTLGSALTRARWYGNINPLSIDYAFRPRLRSRLTLGGRAFPRNPWTSGGGDSHSSFATHANILTRTASTTGLRRRFAGRSTLLYRSCRLDSRRSRA